MSEEKINQLDEALARREAEIEVANFEEMVRQAKKALTEAIQEVRNQSEGKQDG